MMAEAYGLSLVVVLAALSFGLLRAAAVRPTALLAAGIVGVFCVGYVAGHISLRAEGWNQAGQVRTPALYTASTTGEAVSVVAPSSVRGLIFKNGDKISVDIFDAAAAGVSGNHDTVNLSKGASLKMAGWAADAGADAPCKALYVAIGKVRFDAPYGGPRPDVAAYYHNSAYTLTGFSAQIPTGRFPKGAYPVKVECLSADGKTIFVLNRPRAVVIE
jgi:hypothetical protein